MEEKTAKKIMKEYFKRKKRKVIPTRGAGPDFIEAGEAIEVKGSGAKGSRFNRALSQYARYVLRYKGLEVAFPIDVLSAENLIKFTVLCGIAREVKSQSIKTYLITEDTSSTAQLVEEWKKRDPFLLDVDGFQKFLDEQIPKLLKEEDKEDKRISMYYVRSFYHGSEILTSLLDCIPKWSCFKGDFQNTTYEIDTSLSMVNRSIEKALHEIVCGKPDMILPENTLEGPGRAID